MQATGALKKHHARQAARKLKAGKAWQNTGLVFCSPTGTALDAANVRRAFRLITKNAGIGWTPRELRLIHEYAQVA